jgi:hypothetical protein
MGEITTHDEWQSEYRRWIEDICKVYGVTPTAIARRIKAAPSTITRQIKPGWTRRPQLNILRRIAQAYNRAIPESLIGPTTQGIGRLEPDVQQIVCMEAEREPDTSEWEVHSPVLAAIGCNVGDILTFDARIKPIAEDVVIAQVLKYGVQGADTVMRYYMPPYLVAAQLGKPSIPPIQLDPEGVRVVIIGTMIERKFRRKSSSILK